MASFAFKRTLRDGTEAHATMTEAMTLEGDHVVVQYTTDFEGTDLSKLSHKLRKIDPKFEDSGEFQRDVQMLIDENYLNSILFVLFENNKMFSLTETLLDIMPESLPGSTTLIRALMSS